MIGHKLFDVLLFFSSFRIAEQLGEIDRVAINGIFIDMHQLRTLVEVEELFFRKKVNQNLLK